MMLTDAEMRKLVQLFEEMGPRWKVISRYYNIKTPAYFEKKYNPNWTLESDMNGGEGQEQNQFMLKFRKFQ